MGAIRAAHQSRSNSCNVQTRGMGGGCCGGTAASPAGAARHSGLLTALRLATTKHTESLFRRGTAVLQSTNRCSFANCSHGETDPYGHTEIGNRPISCYFSGHWSRKLVATCQFFASGFRFRTKTALWPSKSWKRDFPAPLAKSTESQYHLRTKLRFIK